MAPLENISEDTLHRRFADVCEKGRKLCEAQSRRKQVEKALADNVPHSEQWGNSGGPSRKTKNLKPWKRGQSGNPGGRPKTAALSHACRDVLAQPFPGDSAGRTYAEKIALVLAEKAIAGDIRAAQELADRAEGRARQAIEIEHTPLSEAFERMSREELEAYAVSGTLPSWFSKDDESVQ